LTQNKYTQEASKMLYLADAVIGTGRGLMEAASLKKPLLGINSRGSVPCIIDADTFFDAFKTNFSERNTFNDKHIDNDFDKITKMIGNVDYYNELSNFSDSVFSKYFDIEQSADLYLNFYKNCQYGNNKLKDDFLIVLRNFRHFYKSYLKIKKNA
jgi:glycosyltransferase involved in cell wall biosynthesis